MWHYKNKLRDKRKRIWQSAIDTIFFYTKTDDYTWNPQYEKLDKPKKYAKFKKVNGKKVTVRDENGNVEYMVSHEKLMDNVLEMPMLTSGKERVGYPTQKPMKLLTPLILSGTNEGDWVFDPFCGCATTLVSAERLGRNWVGIDLSPKAFELNRSRLHQGMDEGALFKGGKFPQLHHFVDETPSKTDHRGRMSTKDAKPILFGREKGRCKKCGHDYPYQMFDVDHVIPKAHNGQDILENYQLLCVGCHRLKGTLSDEEFDVKLRELKIID